MNGETSLVKNNSDKEVGWVKAEAPARIDLSGGWSDTPPITNEHGGIVTNVAVKVDKITPIQAKIRKIEECELVLVLGCRSETTLICKTLHDLKDYSNPQATGALLKTAFLCTKTVSLNSPQSLAEQLKVKYGCGFQLHAWSNLPHGSGMGTSSILAGVVCAAIWKITNHHHDNQELLHLVVELEQMLTTGGGWQDQVGGLLPGFKFTTSPSQLPIQVFPRILEVSDDTMKKFSSNTLLIYTGKTRLAKNLLQNVIKRWRTGTPQMIENVHNLTRNAETCAQAWLQGDFERVGLCVNKYREQKKIMAPDSEPDVIRDIIDNIKPYIHAWCLAGAGGGGYLFVMTKQANMHEKLQEILRNISQENNIYTVHRVDVDTRGLAIHET